jgi:hypothetical protein
MVEKLQTRKYNSLLIKTENVVVSSLQNHTIALNFSGITYFILPSGRNFHCLFPQTGQSEFATQDVHCSLTPSVRHTNETETKFA